MEAISAKAHSARIQLKLAPRETANTVIYQVEVAGDKTTTQQTGVSGSLLTIMAAFNKVINNYWFNQSVNYSICNDWLITIIIITIIYLLLLLSS